MNERLKGELEKNGGLLSYADYMSFMLYDQNNGYYMKDKEKIGKNGDFITTSYVSNVYGEIIYSIFRRLVVKNKIPPLFVELGAGDGTFLLSFLEAWEKDRNSIPLTVVVVEKSKTHQKALIQKVNKYSSLLSMYRDLKELGEGLQGFIFSNEFFDAFPVHVIHKRENRIYELFVGMDEMGNLTEIPQSLKRKEIINILQKNDVQLQEGGRLEIPLSMIHYLHELNTHLDKCVMVTVDYGYFDEDYRQPRLQEGSLRGYYKHQVIRNVLDHPIGMDMTSHVHFGLYQRTLTTQKWNHVLTERQHSFFLRAGILNELTNHENVDPFSVVARRNRAIRTLIMGGHISESFHVLVHTKGISLHEEELFEK
ncbi:SAM-dependent methyltransferase [Bacillus sp. FJAT-47783]|uniref:SAM-dependent methyltransferase n=1 Tax=Bacillus sp. FJAT-47783 TaxID=2922712 RepID=UPI001FAC0E10|nr:SAM-dependent methyltransferase [Bacillus sp. FJAT-47783]